MQYGLGGNHIDLLSQPGVDPLVVLRGAIYRGVCDVNIFTIASCDPTPPTKLFNDVPAETRVEPFILGTGYECSMPLSNSPVQQLAAEALKVGEWSAIATVIHSNPDNLAGVLNWADEATDITPATPAGLANTLQGLLDQAACSCWGRGELYLHVPLQYLPYFLEQSLIVWDDNTPKLGPINVVFDCYPNTPPTVNTGGAANVDGSEVWLYLTGPQYIGVGDVLTTDTGYLQQNTNVSLVERYAIGVFDGCCVYAAKAVVC